MLTSRRCGEVNEKEKSSIMVMSLHKVIHILSTHWRKTNIDIRRGNSVIILRKICKLLPFGLLKICRRNTRNIHENAPQAMHY